MAATIAPPANAASGAAAAVAAAAALDANHADPLYAYRRMVGQTLDGRYQIEALLGEGGMGVVFKAHHKVIEKTVAIKLLKREVSDEESVVQRFLQEAKAASRIGHPNIVDVTDFGTLPDGLAYFVMEYIAGKTLAHLIYEQGPIPAQRAIPIVAQLARALSAAHAKGVVHRDLKPDNIFVVDRDGVNDVVKIVDFGIAKVAPVEGNLDAPRLTRVGSVFGTPEYMAPEQAAGRNDLDQRVDIYALGTIFYEMVVGHVPHQADSLVAVLAMQMLDPITPPHQVKPGLGLDPGLEAVIMNALAKERDQRFESMGMLLAALDSAAAAAGLSVMDPLGGTGSMRALPSSSQPPPYRTPPEGVPPFASSASSGQGPTLRTRAPSSTPPQMQVATLPDASIAMGLPTIPDVPAQPPPNQTIRTAGPTDRTWAPDEERMSPFRLNAAAAASSAPKKPGPDTPTVKPPPGAGGPAQPASPSSSEMKSSSGSPTASGMLASSTPTLQGAGAGSTGPAAVLPPAPRPVPPPATSDRFAEPYDAPVTSVSPVARWLLLLLLVGASAAVVYVLLKPNPPMPGAGVAAGTNDASVAAGTRPPSADAAAAPQVAPPDAAPARPAVLPDAGTGRLRTPSGPSSHHHETTPPPPRDVIGDGPPVTVRVYTEPRGGELSTGLTRANPDGTNFTRARGTHLLVECSAPQHKAGQVEIIFDGQKRELTCVMTRLVKCAKELKNPFDPCPE
jgi:serine/threonine protein kinase